MAAPVGGEIFSEILPYLEVSQGNQEEVEQIEQVEIPNIEEMTINEAEKVLKELGLELCIENEVDNLDKENTTISEQVPKEGIKVNKGTKVYVKY